MLILLHIKACVRFFRMILKVDIAGGTVLFDTSKLERMIMQHTYVGGMCCL